MKKAFYVFVSLSTTLTLLQGMAAFGQTPSPSPRPAVTRTPVRQKIEEQRQQLQEKRQAIQQRISEVRKERIRAFWKRMVDRLEAAIKREEKLAERI